MPIVNDVSNREKELFSKSSNANGVTQVVRTGAPKSKSLTVTVAGDVFVNGEHYLFSMKKLAKKKLYFLYSLGNLKNTEDPNSRILKYDDLASDSIEATDYLIGIYSQSLVTGEIKYYGDCNVIRIILDNMSYASNYTFLPENIEDSHKETTDRGSARYFRAQDKNLAYTYKSLNGEMIYLMLSCGTIDMRLEETRTRVNVKNIQLQVAPKEDATHVLTSTLKTIRVSDLDNCLDMSWYHKNGNVLKNYSNVKSIFEFETRVMTPIIKAAIKAHDSGEVLVLSLDTESTGLNTLNLSKDNPSRNHCVSVQLSWEDDQGVAIFNDMEHFQNVDIQYTMRRLGELFEWYKGDREISYYDIDAPVAPNVFDRTRYNPMHMALGLGDDPEETGSSTGSETISSARSLSAFPKKTVVVQRNWFFLVGHNFPFDRRTCYQTDHIALWFNADTLQMAFDLNPRTVRGNNKLKLLTRKLFGHETPELTDILGRGNEDKYKYLVDEEVANIYGCADVDYTRKLFFKLKELMPPALYKRYLQQDVDLSNILAISEYYGMMTYPDKVVSLAEKTYQDLEILKEAAYSYVGAYQEYAQQRILLSSALNSGLCTEEEYNEKVKNIHVDPNAKYRFEFKASSLIDVLYNILKYPILAYTNSNKPCVDKNVMKKLADKKRTQNSTARKLEHDILCYGVDRQEYNELMNGSDADRKKAESMRLISAEKFNGLEYPMAMLIQEYASLNKEYTSYFKPIMEENLEGKIFKGYKMARIETRRISNPGQTMKANLKALVRSYDDDHYVLDFDMSQVEYRIMLSLSGYTEMVERMKNPERDFHTETASMVNRKPAFKVTKKERKAAKSVSFGVPYGLSERSLCEKIYGEINKDNLVKTRLTLAAWKERNAPIVQLLEESRDEALTVWDVPNDIRDFMDAYKRDKKTHNYLLDENGNKIPKQLGRVTNKLGFYRVFDLDNIGQTLKDKARRAAGNYTADESSIRRMAGNYPVQSYAAEVFRTILTRFYWRCVQEGIEDKIIWHMLIHDELLCSVHKSLHPFYIYKLVKESCMITMKGHTKYFVGINIGDTWAECKDDEREAPVFFVDRMVKKWDAGEFAPENTDSQYLKDGDPAKGYWFDHPWEFIKPMREQYVHDRIGEVIRELQDIDNNPIDVPNLLQTFDNYTVRAYVNDYPKNIKVDKKDFAIPAAGEGVYDEDRYDNAVWSSRLESWALQEFGEGKEFIDPDGVLKKLSKPLASVVEEKKPIDEIDLSDLFDSDDLALEDEDDYWSFDEGQIEMNFDRLQTLDEYDEWDLTQKLDMDVSDSKSVNDFLYHAPTYESIRVFNDKIRISYVTSGQLAKLKIVISKYSCSTGYTILFRDPIGQITKWITITDKVDLEKLDKEITEVLSVRR